LTSVRARFERVQLRIADACRAAGRDPAEVTLVAVSKRQPRERLAEAVALGHGDFGENYARELQRKHEEFPDVRWHLVGHLQRNKTKLVQGVALIHSLDGERLARALDRRAAETERRFPVLVQVHQGDESTKTGVEPAAVAPLVEALRDLPGLDPKGLMSLPPPGEGRRYFAELRELRDAVRARTGVDLPDLSMGMSDDFEDAIAEGATIIRIGTALFGARPSA